MLLKISAFWLKLQIVPAFLAAKLRRRLLVSIGFRSTVNRLQNERIIVVKQIPLRNGEYVIHHFFDFQAYVINVFNSRFITKTTTSIQL